MIKLKTTRNNQYHSSPATLASLLSPRFACSKYRMTTKDHQRQWTIIHDKRWSLPLTSHLLSYTINWHSTFPKRCWERCPPSLVGLVPVTAFFLDPVKQVSLADICNTLIFRGDWETGINCKVYTTFSGKLVAPSQSWKGGHQYQLNIKQEDLKVYDRIQTNSSNQYHSSPATLVSLLSPRFACSKYRMTTKDHQWPWTIIHDQT